MKIAIGVVASGLLFAFAQNVEGGEWCALACLVPFCIWADPGRFWRFSCAVGALGILFAAFTLWWMAHTGSGFACWVVVLAAAVNALFLAPVVLACGFCNWLPGPARLLALPLGWWIGEVLQRHLLLRVSLTVLGLPLAEWPATAQVVAASGVEVLSFLAASVAVSLALLLRPCPWKWRGLAFLQGPVLLALATGFGGLRMVHPPAKAGILNVGLIQPNIPQIEKWEPGKREATLARLVAMTDRAAALGADLIVLPETAVTGFVRYENDLTAFVKDAVGRTGRPLLFGTLDRNDAATEFYNVAILITPYNTVTAYRKNRLVPLAEYQPPLPWARRLSLGGRRWEFTPGKRVEVFELLPDNLKFSALICFEDIFPELARAGALAGAQFLVALVNTQRFDGTAEPLQQLRRARLSAIASGLPLVRSTNSGISCTVDSYGRITARMENAESVAGGLVRVIGFPVAPVETFYRAHGDAVPSVLAGIFLIAGVIRRLMAARPGRHSFRGGR